MDGLPPLGLLGLLAGIGGGFKTNDAHGYIPMKDKDAFIGKGRGRTHTAQDDRAKAKRVAKRRKKKGYR